MSRINRRSSGLPSPPKQQYSTEPDYSSSATSKIKCPKCTSTFTIKSNLTRHIKRIHEGISFSCSWLGCYKNFSSNNSKKKHIDIIHRGIKNFTCTACKKQFGYLTDLYRHIKTKKHIKNTIGGASSQHHGVGSSSNSLLPNAPLAEQHAVPSIITRTVTYNRIPIHSLLSNEHNDGSHT